ncbi:MAG: hypothetical protein EXR07_12625 [Acetobacteraceae bacterium]|nr:hypothetical protein [Acetobacteraceae bacterium]
MYFSLGDGRTVAKSGGMFSMAGPILYSANPFMAYEICCRYLNGKHHVWRSEVFDPTTQASISSGSMIGPTSSPAAIVKALAADTKFQDRHSHHIQRYKKIFRRLAATWMGAGLINARQAQEIRELVGQNSYLIWRPMLYIIPREPLQSAGRLIAVPVKDRATHGPEYQIRDLDTVEFDALEWSHV